MSKLRIGILCSEPVPLQKDIIGTGAGLRAIQLGTFLSSWSEVYYVVPETEGIVYFHPQVHTFPEGKRSIEEYIPQVDILIAVQWPIVNLLKEKPDVPLIIDFLSPLLLENQYQPTYNQKTFLSSKIEAIRKADGFFASSSRQKAYFIPWLNLAGFDMTRNDLIKEIPVVFQDLQTVKFNKKAPLQFIHTGYFWPWQETVPYLKIVADIALKNGDSVIIYGGKHPYWTNFTGSYYDVGPLLEKPNVTLKDPVPFAELDRMLHTNCIGLDLCAPNYERFLSSPLKHSFYLAKQMPVIVSSMYEYSYLRWKKCGWALQTSHVPSFRRVLKKIYPSLRRSYKGKMKKVQSTQKRLMKQASAGMQKKYFENLSHSPPPNDAFYEFLPDYARLKFNYAEMEKALHKKSIVVKVKNTVRKILNKV